MVARRTLSALVSAAVLALAGCHDVRIESRSKPGEIGIYDDLFAVSVVDANVVYAAGYYGAIYKTTDGGTSWTKQDTGTLKSLYDISMADADKGWAVGQMGLVLRTTDGGRTWIPQPNLKEKEGAQLFGVRAIDGNTAWAVGEWGTRLFTSDGGATWQDFSLTITENHPQFVWLAPVDQDRVRRGDKVYEDLSLNDVYCLPQKSDHCWIAGEFGYVFWSDNAGQAWTRAEIIGDIKPEPIAVPYNATDITAADIAKLRDFSQRIASESHLNVEIEPKASAAEIAAYVKPDDPTPLFEILEARATSVRSVVEDAGILSDRIRMRGSPPWDWEDFQKNDPTFLKRYLEARRSDSPGIDVRVAQNPYLFTVRYRDEKSGFISGLGGLILQSRDGGHTYGYKRTVRKQALFSVATADGRAVAVGEKGFVQVSTDNGESWNTPKEGFPSIFTFMRDIAFSPDTKSGYIVGQAGTVLRSTDQGATWTQVLPPAKPAAKAEGSGH
jgi:photosystem II stability/assembly factor-like uncharacterized protein